MAVSQQNLNRSVQCYAAGMGPGPVPDAPFEAGHAAHIAWLYAGIPYGAAAEVAAADASWRPVWRPRRRM